MSDEGWVDENEVKAMLAFFRHVRREIEIVVHEPRIARKRLVDLHAWQLLSTSKTFEAAFSTGFLSEKYTLGVDKNAAAFA